jgi:hypothetical protein
MATPCHMLRATAFFIASSVFELQLDAIFEWFELESSDWAYFLCLFEHFPDLARTKKKEIIIRRIIRPKSGTE